MRFNPLMERFEALTVATEDRPREWTPIEFRQEPTVFINKIPMGCEPPMDGWFPISEFRYTLKRKSFVQRFVERLLKFAGYGAVAEVARWHVASAMSAGTVETQSGSGLQPASAVPQADAQ